MPELFTDAGECHPAVYCSGLKQCIIYSRIPVFANEILTLLGYPGMGKNVSKRLFRELQKKIFSINFFKKKISFYAVSYKYF